MADGFSLLTAALLRAVHIPTVTILGVAIKQNHVLGPHAWNEAFVDNRWISIDTTQDARSMTPFVEVSNTDFNQTHKAILDFK